MKLKYIYIIIAALSAFFASCSEDDVLDTLTTEQRKLIGTAVNFNASLSDEFTSRTSYDYKGTFNEQDIMVIYRQYYNDTRKEFDWGNEVFHAYYNKYKYATGTEISLGKDWMVADGSTKHLTRLRGEYSGTSASRTLQTHQQTKGDSLIWENGKTLRFRAWSRSNLANTLANGSKSSYYPDFEISDWVNVSGPTNAIPLTLKHITSRIFFLYRNSGNRLSRVEITTDPADYMRSDNADGLANDLADKTYPKTFKYNGETITINNAEEAAQKVKDVYDRMCMPAGVNLDNGTLVAMTKAAYNATTDFSHIEEWSYTPEGKAKLVEYNSKTPQAIATDVQRPVFTGAVDNRCYLITIPYDMSNAPAQHGHILVLPPWTRFKVWLYDVNSGDKGSSEIESEYHIFALDDITKKVDGVTTPVFEEGLSLKQGYSYEFQVGYRYDRFSITPGESFSWLDQDATIIADAADDTQARPAANKYLWWKNAIQDAIPRGDENYNPEFHITNEEQFIEFINLVNGTAGAYGADSLNNKIYRLVKEYKTVTNANGTVSKIPVSYGWSRVNNERAPQWVEKEVLEEEGYIFYEHYFPADGDKAAYSVEDYLKGPYSFYDTNLRRHFSVYLDTDLDFKDIKIDGVGTDLTPFMGYFDGAPSRTVHLNGDGTFAFTDDVKDPRIIYDEVTETTAHTIRNLNVNGCYLFNHVTDAAIRNVFLQSYNTVGLLNTATPSMNGTTISGWGCYITGISVKANNASGYNAIARSLTGRSYVVGCIHEGDAGGALVGSASDMYMYGCMRTSANIAGGALLGAYPDATDQYLAPSVSFNTQFATKNYSTKPTWGRFMCNYYNKDIHETSKDATAIGGIADDYSVFYYIRGRASRILRAKNDNLLAKDVPLSSLKTTQQLEEFYGLAPWKAMNYAIYKYNTDKSLPGSSGHECKVHFEVNATGYDHVYPQLKSGAPVNYSSYNVLDQNN